MRAQRGIVPAIDGLAFIPTANATRELVGLLGQMDVAIADAAARAVIARLPEQKEDSTFGPRHPFGGAGEEPRTYLSTHAWDPSFTDDVRAAARKRLGSTSQRTRDDGDGTQWPP